MGREGARQALGLKELKCVPTGHKPRDPIISAFIHSSIKSWAPTDLALIPSCITFEKPLMLGKIEGRRKRGRQRMRRLDGITDSMGMSLEPQFREVNCTLIGFLSRGTYIVTCLRTDD